MIDIYCHSMTCEDGSDLDSYEFEATIFSKDNDILPDTVHYSDIIAACYRILLDDTRSRGDIVLAKWVRARVGEAKWALAAIENL